MPAISAKNSPPELWPKNDQKKHVFVYFSIWSQGSKPDAVLFFPCKKEKSLTQGASFRASFWLQQLPQYTGVQGEKQGWFVFASHLEYKHSQAPTIRNHLTYRAAKPPVSPKRPFSKTSCVWGSNCSCLLFHLHATLTSRTFLAGGPWNHSWLDDLNIIIIIRCSQICEIYEEVVSIKYICTYATARVWFGLILSCCKSIKQNNLSLVHITSICPSLHLARNVCLPFCLADLRHSSTKELLWHQEPTIHRHRQQQQQENYLSNIIIIMRFSGISIKKGISNAPLNQNENNVWLIFSLVHTMHSGTSSKLELPDVCRTQFAVVPDHMWQRDSPRALTTWSALQYLISDNKKRLPLGKEKSHVDVLGWLSTVKHLQPFSHMAHRPRTLVGTLVGSLSFIFS